MLNKKIFRQGGLFFFILTSSFFPHTVFSQIGNTNGQYDEVIEQAYTLLQNIHNGDKKTLKEKFTETNFQSKKEFKKTVTTSNLKWAKKIISDIGIPEKKDLVIASWKTSSKTQESTFSINITFYFRKQNQEFSNSNDHICFNFYKSTAGKYFFNGLFLFKKSDFLNVKKLSDNSK